MTAGNPELRTYNQTEAQQAISHVCLNYAGGGPPEAPAFPTVNCPDGLRSQVYFPSCWDGVNLDSANHQSHVAYPLNGYNGGQCPDSHPVPLISIFYEFIFGTGDFSDMWHGDSQPFVYSMGDNSGFGFHGDFVNGWDVQLLQKAIDEFTTDDAGDADNIYYNNYFTEPAVSGTQCSLPPMVNEQVNGVLAALPGCNPVTDNPVPATNCLATTTLGTYTSSIYTDMTAKGWEYLGCGIDEYGNTALTGPIEDTPTMTVETCISLCGGKGYSIAGLEYASQCFCGNTLPARASPTPGVIGTCTMACKGNSTEMCGAGNRLSLYQKCSGTCQNAQFGVNAPVVSAVPATATPTAGTGSYSTAAGSSMISSVVTAPADPSSTSSLPNAVISTTDAAPATTDATDPYSYPPTDPSTTATAASVSGVASTPVTTDSAIPSPTPSTIGPLGPSSSGLSNVTLPSGWTAAGCYVDNLNPRSLNGDLFAYWGEAMTSSGCAAHCSTEGFTYAGTENAGQCFCGNELVQSATAPATDCNLPCEGSASETCGGPARLSVFTSSSSTTSTVRRRRSHMRRHGVHYRGAQLHGSSM